MENTSFVHALPTKELFIFMLTKDIDIEPAIIELVDNAIDAGRDLRKTGYTGPCEIRINTDNNSFQISDTCGGITFDDAQNRCFNFGKNKKMYDESQQEAIGYFGIGMKRALFKLGRKFKVESITSNHSFVIAVDVDEWIEEKDWEFKVDNYSEEFSETVNCGTTIIIDDLYENVKAKLNTTYFKNEFKKYLKSRIMLVDRLNISVFLNNEEVKYESDSLCFTQEIKPAVEIKTVDNDVTIKVICGFAHYGKPEKAGWTIYCNNRMVIDSDKSNLTVWSSNKTVLFHKGEHAAFRGYVYIESKDLGKLPWNTTKTGVDDSSDIYLEALDMMTEMTKDWLKKKNELKNSLRNNDQIEITDFINGFDEIKIDDNIFIDYSKKTQDLVLDIPNNDDEDYRQTESRICFNVDSEKANILKNKIGCRSLKELGIKCFEYCYKEIIGENE